jgi:hypothetical protein
MATKKNEPLGPLIKPRRPFNLPPNRTHKNKKDLVGKPKHKDSITENEGKEG